LVLAAGIRGSIRDGLVPAAYAGWRIVAGCGHAVLLLGLLCTTQWAKATASRLGGGPKSAEGCNRPP